MADKMIHIQSFSSGDISEDGQDISATLLDANGATTTMSLPASEAPRAAILLLMLAQRAAQKSVPDNEGLSLSTFQPTGFGIHTIADGSALGLRVELDQHANLVFRLPAENIPRIIDAMTERFAELQEIQRKSSGPKN